MSDTQHQPRPIDPKDLYAALRLSLEGTEEDRRMFARVMQTRYPYIEGLAELNARHWKVKDILRGGETDG